MTGHFDPATGRLELELPLPPPKNALRGQGQFANYPKAPYREWLLNVVPLLQETLNGWEPDTRSWWCVKGRLWLGPSGDGPNYQEAVLDFLSGKHYDPQSRRLTPGPGLWDDDRRVHLGSWAVAAVRCAEPRLLLTVTRAEPPVDERAERQARERAEREQARQRERQERERQRQAREAERQRQREAKEQEREARRTLARDAILLATRGGALLRHQIPAPVRTRILRAAECGPAAYKAALDELRAERGVTAPTRNDEAWRER